jgi:low affinity Fe/Cu permease
MHLLTPPHASHLTRLGFLFRRLESILANGAASGRLRPMAMIGPCFKEEIMIIMHDAGPSRYGVEPGCMPLRRDIFERISLRVARSTSGRDGFCFATLLILAWVGVGPYCGFHQSWTAAFSVVTSSVSFLLLFFIRHVQSCESKAVHLKLDELIYAAQNARNELISIEHLTEEQLDHLSRRYLKLAGHYRRTLLQADGSPLSTPRDRPGLFLDDPLRVGSADDMPDEGARTGRMVLGVGSGPCKGK